MNQGEKVWIINRISNWNYLKKTSFSILNLLQELITLLLYQITFNLITGQDEAGHDAFKKYKSVHSEVKFEFEFIIKIIFYLLKHWCYKNENIYLFKSSYFNFF